MLKNPAEYERMLRRQNSAAIISQVSPDSILGVSAGICQRALMDESGMIRTQVVTHNR
jgi:hypothetical protein